MKRWFLNILVRLGFSRTGTYVEIGDHWIDLSPHVELACRSTGFFPPSAASILANLISEYERKGRDSMNVTSHGDCFGKDELFEMGIDKWTRLSRSVHALLTEKGKIRPVDNIQFVVARSLAWAYDQGRSSDRNNPDVKRVFPYYIFHAEPNACLKASKMRGRKLSLKQIPRIPMEDCAHECSCWVEGVIRKRSKS